MKAFGGKTPENEIDEPFIDDDDIEDPVTVLRGRIRRRDGYRCLISGAYDCATSHLWNMADPAGVSADLDVGYIIPYSIIRSLKCDDNDDERRRQAGIWKILYRYFPDTRDILDTLKSNESDMDDTLNVMMIEKCLHQEYGGFHMTLEKNADMENKYRIKTFPSFVTAYSALLPLDGLAILSPRDGDRYKPPNQALLAVHASAANILHATGRARMVDGLLDQYQRCMRLRWDGGTDVAGLLSVSQLGGCWLLLIFVKECRFLVRNRR